MGNALRNQPFASYFSELRITPTINVQDAKIYFYFGMIALCFLLILPGVRGMDRCWMLLRVSAALWIGAVLVVCNYSAWYGATICTRTQYKPHTDKNAPQEIQAVVGLYIGFRGINITLVENNCESADYVPPFPNEIINYNEHFSWLYPWSLGKQDSGNSWGKFRQEFRMAKYRGVPHPIIWVAEHFIIDGEQILWYRKFRQAGWYTRTIMWFAFATHLFSLLLFMTNIRMGAWQMAATGFLMIIACLVYSVTIICDPALKIHFPDQTLTPHFKYAFWLNLVTGVATATVACIILILYRMIPRKVATFFHHNIAQDDSIFEGDEEFERFQEKFALKRLSRSNNGSSCNKRKRHTKPVPQEKLEEIRLKEMDKLIEVPASSFSVTDQVSRPSSVIYTYPDIRTTALETLSTVSESPTHGILTSHELEMEVQIAEITIHTTD